MTQHEIEFKFRPSALYGFCGTGKDILFGKSLVDNIPESLGTCFRSKGNGGLLDVLHLVHDIQ